MGSIENQNIEYKENWDDSYLEWICGFANAEGGTLYIGVKDNGEIIGISNAKKLSEDIPNKVKTTLGIVVTVNILQKDSKQYLEISIPSYQIGISYKGVYYFRSGSTCQILTGPALESFILKQHGVTWDKQPFPIFTIDNVDDKAIEHFKELAIQKGRIDESFLNESRESLLDKLHLTNGEYLTNAAMLLFSKDPERWQVGAYVKIGFFKNDADLLYQDEIHGPLLEQVDKITELVYLKYMKASISYNGMVREERYFLPKEAFREALLNAIWHKKYESGIPIQISVYEDKIYISNCGKLPDTWTVDNLFQKHSSIPYNPIIANVFYLVGLIESWGRGIEKIVDACKENNTPTPIYTIHPSDIMVEFDAAKDFLIIIPDKFNGIITDKEKEVLMLLIENPSYTRANLSAKLNLSNKTIAARIKTLKDKGIIERVGNDRLGYWKIID